MATKGERLELRLDAELRRKLDELAKLREVAASVVIRRSILDAHRLAFPNARDPGPSVAVIVRSPEPESVSGFHERLWGQAPSDAQEKLYAIHGRGFFGVLGEAHVDAVATTALFISSLRPDDDLVVFAPINLQDLFSDRVRAAYGKSKGKPIEGAVAKAVGRARLGAPTTWPPAHEPRVWVAIGLAVDETAPKWIRRRLIETGPDASGEEAQSAG